MAGTGQGGNGDERLGGVAPFRSSAVVHRHVHLVPGERR